MGQQNGGQKPKRQIAVIGDDDGSLVRAVSELQACDGVAEGVTLVGVSIQALGMGSGTPVPMDRKPDFLDDSKPWTGQPDIH